MFLLSVLAFVALVFLGVCLCLFRNRTEAMRRHDQLLVDYHAQRGSKKGGSRKRSSDVEAIEMMSPKYDLLATKIGNLMQEIGSFHKGHGGAEGCTHGASHFLARLAGGI